MHASRTGIFAAAVFMAAGATASAQTFRVLPGPNGTQAYSANGVSKNGIYIGGQTTVATIWDAERVPALLPVGGEAYAVSNDGQVAGGYYYATGTPYAWVWDHGSLLSLGRGECLDVTSDGTLVVGWVWRNNNPMAFCYPFSGTLVELPCVEGDTYSQAYAVDDAGKLVVGVSRNFTSGHRSRACVWDAAGGPPTILDAPPPGERVEATDISGDGHVIVGFTAGGSLSAGLRWIDGVCEVIIPADRFAFPTAVSDDGRVVVGHGQQFSGAFIWTEASGARSLKQLLSEAGYDMSRISVYEPRGLSADGRIVTGMGWDAQGHQRGWEVVLETDCAVDINKDFVVDFFDYLDFAALFDSQDPRADFNGDQTVDFFDYLDFVAAFEAGCE